MRVAKVALVRQAEVDLVLVEGVLDLVGEDTRRETRDDLRRVRLVRGVQHVVVDEHVVAEECEL